MGASRRNQVPADSSWRLVEGENDSFDTSLAAEYSQDPLASGNSEGQPSQVSQLSGLSSQLSASQPFSIGGSQGDNLESFLDRAEDERLILCSPFRPSVPPSVRQDSRDNKVPHHRAPEPEPGPEREPDLVMPRLDMDGRSSSTSTARSRPGLRQRQGDQNQGRRPWEARDANASSAWQTRQAMTPYDKFTEHLSRALFGTLSWLLDVLGLVFHYAKKPIAVAVVLYLLYFALHLARTSAYTVLSPICRVPLMDRAGLPFCSDYYYRRWAGWNTSSQPVEFDGLMGMQDQFEEVLEKSAQGVSLPLEMKRSESSVRDLRMLVQFSSLPGKEELALEFDGYMEAARVASNDLQRFNSRVGFAVDHVIAINRHTARYLDGFATKQEEEAASGWLGRLAGRLLAPFQAADVFSEQRLLDQYVEHTAAVSDKIADLIVEAQAVLWTLARAEDHLDLMTAYVVRTQRVVQSRREDVLWTLRTLVGANMAQQRALDEDLAVLRRVDRDRAGAVEQVSSLVVELQRIQAGLDDLRDRVAAPRLAAGSGAKVPLAVHIETIDRGVERLEAARNRIRAVEEQKIEAVLKRGKAEKRIDMV